MLCRRLLAAGAAAAVALVGAGCRLDVAVGIDDNANGTGSIRAVVTLDEAAKERVPDLVASYGRTA